VRKTISKEFKTTTTIQQEGNWGGLTTNSTFL
jgi:hypothetical protein